jgi:hypothetical protein
MKLVVTGESGVDQIDVTGGQATRVIDVTAALVSSVNGRSGAVTGLAEAAEVQATAETAATTIAEQTVTAAVNEHTTAEDPHDDRAYADGKFLPLTGGTLTDNLDVTTIAGSGTSQLANLRMGPGGNFGGGAGGLIALQNADTVPTSAPSQGAVLYAEAGILKARLATGAVVAAVDGNEWTPNDHGLIAWTHDPATLRSTSNPTTSGTVYLSKLKVINRGVTATTILVGIETAGSGLTAGQCYVGLYNSSGSRLAISADQASNWTSTGLKTISLTTPPTLAVGNYYVAILANGTTPPQFAMGAGGATSVNAGLATAAARFLSGPAAQTSLPTSITLGSQTPQTGARWAALS